MHDIHRILLKYWGYSSFRPLQEDIIQHVLKGKDTLALLPTGGGKSICFQVPAMALEGLCLVVTPLVALMKDQVRNLKDRGISAASIHSGLKYRQIDIILDNCRLGKVKFLYVSPERLHTELFQSRFRDMPVSLIAVDEAHCISQWGYDFRPAYLKIAEIRELHPQIPIIALTATARPKVVDDICEKLEFEDFKVFRKSFKRGNLSYSVLQEDAKLDRLIRILSRVPGTSVVYVRNRKKTREIAAFLQSKGISSSFYHAGLSHEEKSKREEAWRTDKIRVMVSTNAFGMGIDKPDVRTVVHLDLPDSLEAYFQEAGRGGRDEKKAYAVLLFDPADKHKTEKQLNAGFPDMEDCRKLYQNLADQYKIAIGSGEGESFDFDLAEFCKRFNWEPLKAFQALKLLEQNGSISLSDAIYQPPRIQVTATREQLYKVQVEHSAYESLIQCLLRSYPGIFDDSVRVSIKDIARLSHLEPQATVLRLKTLHDRELIEFTQSTENPYLTFLQPRQDSSRLRLDPQFIADRKKEHEDRLHAMLSYVGNSETCRSVQLCRFFGEEDASRCGICDVCIAFKKTGLTDRGFEEIRSRIKAILKDERHSIRYFVDVLNMPETETLSVVQWMIEHNEVFEENGKLKLL